MSALDTYTRRRRRGRPVPRWSPTDGVYLAKRLVDQLGGDLGRARMVVLAASWGPAPVLTAERRTANRLLEELDGDVARALVLLSRAA